MVLNRPYYSPTRVYYTQAYGEAIGQLISGRSWAIATSRGWRARGALESVYRFAGEPVACIETIPENPKVSDVVGLADKLTGDAEIIVALGGGSVIDCAKSIAGYCGLGKNDEVMTSHLRDGENLPPDFEPLPVIAVPTTSGTGSEVTQWATVWGDDQVKFSFTHPKLFPMAAVLDAALCLSMPPDVTLASGLDALSHALESIWNRNQTDLSDQIAANAIQIIKVHLPIVMKDAENVESRRQMQTAAVLSGLAMGTTQTALAHSLSYPFTARYDMPHGFACSFTLPEVARFNMDEDADRVAIAADAFGAQTQEFPDLLDRWLRGLDLGKYISPYLRSEDIAEMGDGLITRARAANNIRSIDGPAARDLARKSFESFETQTSSSSPDAVTRKTLV